MHRHTSLKLLARSLLLAAGALLLLSPVEVGAQAEKPEAPKPPQRPRVRQDTGDYRLSVDVDLVVLHTTVVDPKGHIVSELKRENFRVYEDGVPQEVAIFRQEDLPLTVGLVIDNSGSMHHVKQELRAAALTFVETSNPADEVFVVNFNDDYYLDLGPGKDFSSDIHELREALEKTDTRGGTALWDALRASLDHAKRSTRQKRVLLLITDGVDRYSRTKFDELLEHAQKSESTIYVVMLRGDEEPRDWRRARRQLTRLAQATGGEVYFPGSTDEVKSLCRKIAQDIRNQYILAYYPTNRARDGSYRNVRVEVRAQRSAGKLIARTRTGYYAPAPEGAGSNGP